MFDINGCKKLLLLVVLFMCFNACTSSTLRLHISSNEDQTEFIVDGTSLGTSQRIRTNLENGIEITHTVVARLNGYCEKKREINPPYMQPTVVDFLYKGGDECIPCPEPCHLNYGKYHALIIGNNSYTRGLPNLITAQKDARKIAEILKNKYGFTVKLIENASYDDINNAIEVYQNGTKDKS